MSEVDAFWEWVETEFSSEWERKQPTPREYALMQAAYSAGQKRSDGYNFDPDFREWANSMALQLVTADNQLATHDSVMLEAAYIGGHLEGLRKKGKAS